MSSDYIIQISDFLENAISDYNKYDLSLTQIMFNSIARKYGFNVKVTRANFDYFTGKQLYRTFYIYNDIVLFSIYETQYIGYSELLIYSNDDTYNFYGKPLREDGKPIVFKRILLYNSNCMPFISTIGYYIQKLVYSPFLALNVPIEILGRKNYDLVYISNEKSTEKIVVKVLNRYKKAKEKNYKLKNKSKFEKERQEKLHKILNNMLDIEKEKYL